MGLLLVGKIWVEMVDCASERCYQHDCMPDPTQGEKWQKLITSDAHNFIL